MRRSWVGLVAVAVLVMPGLPAAAGTEAEPEIPWAAQGMAGPYTMDAVRGPDGPAVVVAGYAGGAALLSGGAIRWRHADGLILAEATFGDLTGDGVDDVVLGQHPGSVTVLDGADGTVLAVLDTAAVPGGLAVADATGDGRADLYVVQNGYLGTPNLVQLYDGADLTPRWSTSIGADESITMNATAGDFDGDGRAEVAFGTFSNGPRLHAYSPDGAKLWVKDLGGTVSNVAVADGGRSLIATRTGGLLVGLDSRTGAERWSVPATGAFSRLAVADLDGDGTDDAVWAPGGLTGYGPQNQVLAVDGATGLPRWALPTAQAVKALAAGDLDGDGAPDVLAATQDVLGTQSQAVNVVLALDGRTGAHRWSRTWAGEPMSAFSAVAVADLDADGNADALAAPYFDVLLGLRGSDGSDLRQVPLGSRIDEATLADLDGDGSAEVVTAGGDFRVESRGAGDGALRWARDLGAEPVAVVAVPASGGGNDVLVIALSTLHRLRGRDGATLWSRPLQGWGIDVLPVDADRDGTHEILVSARLPRAVHGAGRLVGDTYSGTLELLDGANGRLRWVVETPGAAVLLGLTRADGDAIPDVVTSSVLPDVGLITYDGARLGELPVPLWQRTGMVVLDAAVEQSGILAVVPAAKSVVRLDPATGADVWSRPFTTSVRSLGFGDLDGDDRPDALIATGTFADRVAVVDGQTGAVELDQDLAQVGLRYAQSAAAADVSGDGAPDLVLGSTAQSSLGGTVAFDGARLDEGIAPLWITRAVHATRLLPLGDGSGGVVAAGGSGPRHVLALLR